MQVTGTAYCSHSGLKTMHFTGAVTALIAALKASKLLELYTVLDSSLKIMQVTGAAYCLNSRLKS